jgi:hypothetical protein
MKKSNEKPLSLRPLKFKEAVADLLKVEPQAEARISVKKANRK